MKPDGVGQGSSGKGPDAGGAPGIALRFPRGKPTRELILIRVAFWAVIVGFVLLCLFVFWGLFTHAPSQETFDSSD
jgi:hypothetical protein